MPPELGGGPFAYIIVPTIAIIAGVLALLRSDRTMLRQDNEDLRNGRDDDEKEIAKLKERCEKYQSERDIAIGENTILKELNSRQPDFREIVAAVAHHNDLVEARWLVEDTRANSFKVLLQAILEVLGGNKPEDSNDDGT